MSTEELKRLSKEIQVGTLATRALTIQLRRQNLISRIDMEILSGKHSPEKVARLRQLKGEL